MEIRAVHLVLSVDGESYSVYNPISEHDKRTITKIRENSIQTEQNFLHVIQVMVGDAVAIELINAPMKIEYFEED